MKPCPFCAEEIQEAAIKCRHCGEFIDGSSRAEPEVAKPQKWYQSTVTIVIGLATLGPFALPLVWRHPTYKLATKITLTVVVAVVTVWCFYVMKGIMADLQAQLDALGIQ